MATQIFNKILWEKRGGEPIAFGLGITYANGICDGKSSLQMISHRTRLYSWELEMDSMVQETEWTQNFSMGRGEILM